MLQFNLTDGKREYRYLIPENAREITCGQVAEFQQKIESKKPESLKEYELRKSEEREEYLKQITTDEIEKKWTSFYMRELMFWCKIPANIIGLIPVSRPDGNDLAGLRAILSKAFKVTKQDMPDGFKYKGNRYYLPPSPVNLIDPNRTDYMRGATLGEFATASELYRAYSQMLSGSCLALLHVIAILCRRKDEKMPSLPDEQNDWIKARVEHLKDLDFNTAMNVGFFLSFPQSTSKKPSVYSKAVAKLRRLRRNTATI